MLTSVVADGIALQWLRHSIMTEKLARRGLQVPQDYEADLWQQTPVEDVMTKNVLSLSVENHAGDLLAYSIWERQSLIPILDKEGLLVAVLSRHDALRALAGEGKDKTLGEIGQRELALAYPQESLKQAIGRLLYHDVGCLPVVDPDRPTHLLGLLERRSLFQAYRTRLEEEHDLEKGWFSQLS